MTKSVLETSTQTHTVLDNGLKQTRVTKNISYADGTNETLITQC